MIRIETTAPGFGLSGPDGTQSVQGCVDIGFGWVVRPLGNRPDRHRIPGRDTTWQRPLKGREGGIALSLLPIVSQRRAQDQRSCQADRIDGARGDGRLGILSNLEPARGFEGQLIPLLADYAKSVPEEDIMLLRPANLIMRRRLQALGYFLFSRLRQ